jgi:Epoxide hydrolase N terminus
MTTEKPFRISISAAEIHLLKQKLGLVRFPDEVQDLENEWTYGAPLKDIKRLVAHWKDGYDWKRYEDNINQHIPMFTRDIDIEGEGILNIQYVHQRSSNERAIPLLFVHGCEC